MERILRSAMRVDLEQRIPSAEEFLLTLMEVEAELRAPKPFGAGRGGPRPRPVDRGEIAFRVRSTPTPTQPNPTTTRVKTDIETVHGEHGCTPQRSAYIAFTGVCWG